MSSKCVLAVWSLEPGFQPLDGCLKRSQSPLELGFQSLDGCLKRSPSPLELGFPPPDERLRKHRWTGWDYFPKVMKRAGLFGLVGTRVVPHESVVPVYSGPG